MKEVYADRKKDTTMWQPSESDPNLEAAFLARFMQYLGVDGQQAEQALTQSVAARSNASELARVDNGTLLLAGDYGRNWRRTALALDRIGLTVIGQNAERRAFLVQQAPTEGEAVANKKPGLFKRVFGKGKAEAPKTYPESSCMLSLSTMAHAPSVEQRRQPIQRQRCLHIVEPPAHRIALIRYST